MPGGMGCECLEEGEPHSLQSEHLREEEGAPRQRGRERRTWCPCTLPPWRPPGRSPRLGRPGFPDLAPRG